MSDELELTEPVEDSDTGSVSGEIVSPYVVSDIFTSDEQRESFASWICSEIRDVRDGGERKEKEKEWQTNRRIRRAKKKDAVRNTPWIRSAAVESTLAAQKVNAIYAKEVAAFAVKKPPVRVTSGNPLESQMAESLERFFTHVSDNRYGMNMPVVRNQLFFDQVSLGCAPVKIPFRIDEWSFKRKSAEGTETVNYVRHYGPAAIPIRLEDFFTRPYWKDIQRAPWVGVRYRMFGHELHQKIALQFFTPEAETVLALPLSKYDDSTESSLKDASIETPSLNKAVENDEFEIYEINAFYDVDGDGYAEDVIVWVEPDTQTILRSEFNPLSIRDIEILPYIEDPESLYPIGVCDLVGDLQEEATSLKRMRLDGTQLAMLKMFVTSTGSGIDPNEEFRPFKHYQVDNPATDFRTIDFPDVAQSCLLGEEMTKQEADRVTGANDYMTGFNDKTVGSGASVGGTMFLAQQGNSILNSILSRAEQSIGNMYMIALYQCMANAEKVDLSFLSPEDQTNMRNILSFKVEDIPTKFRFKVETTDITKTDEAQRQAVLGASQLYSMYGQQLLQLAQMSPQLQQKVPEITLQLAYGATELMSSALEKMGFPNPGDLLPYFDDIGVQLDAADRMRGEQTRQMKEAMNNATGSVVGTGANGSGQGSGGAPMAPGGSGTAGGAGFGVAPGAQGSAGF